MKMMSRNDEELNPSRINKGGAYSREGASGDEEFMLQYLTSIL
jgi:hypothetical protein